MDFKTIGDGELIETTEGLVREERERLTTILHCLREIDRRRLYSERGYKSLFDFAVRHFCYAEDQAYRRIAAMRLLNDVPEVETKINSGEISLTHINLAQTLFRQEAKSGHKSFSKEEKIEVLERIANKSVREAQRITLSLSSTPELARPEKIQPISETAIELRCSAPKELEAKLNRLKGIIAHRYPGISTGDLLDKLCDLGLETWVKSAAPKKCRVTTESRAGLRRQAFERAGNRCENCQSTYALEIDHILPRALGGADNLKNSRVLCRSCNQRAAILAFGLNKMQPYLGRQF